MDAALQRRVQRYGWDKAAAFYESFWQKQLLPAQNKLLELADLQPAEKIIDIACGTGLVSFRAAEITGDNGLVLGTDLSDKMVELSIIFAKQKNINNTSFQQMDAEELQTEDNLFDVALCALGLMYVPDPVKALKEMYRTVKPGGRVAIAVWGQRKNCGWAEVFEIVDKRVASEVCPMFFNLGNPDILEMSLKNAGFNNIKIEKLSEKLIYNTDEDACGAAFAGGPVALAYNKFNDTVKEEAHTEYLNSIKAFKQNDRYEIPGEFVVGIAYKD